MIVHTGSDERGLAALRVVKFSSCRQLILRLACGEAVYFEIHWTGKRQMLCPGASCPVCGGTNARVVGFLGVELQTELGWSSLSLIGVTAGPVRRAMEKAVGMNEAWRPGLTLQVSKRALNSPILLDPIGTDVTGLVEVGAIRIVEAAAVLFGVPVPMLNESVEAWSGRVSPFAARALKQAS